MIRPLMLTLALLFGTPALAALPGPLVEADWLHRHLERDDLVVLDVRSTIDDGDHIAFAQARIPGSRYSNYIEDGWRENRDGVTGLLPAVTSLEALIGGLGIDNASQVVIVPAGTGPTDFGSAARIYWTFKVLGHDAVAILDGGFAGWRQRQLPIASGPIEPLSGATFHADLREELIATTEEVEAARHGRTQLVDARPRDYFMGDSVSPAVRVAGTIPGARSLPHHTHLHDRRGAHYLDTQGLAARLDAAELDRSGRTIVFCNTGHWAATDWFVLSEVAGLEEVALYDGSMAEWTISDTRPVQLIREGLRRVGELLPAE